MLDQPTASDPAPPVRQESIESQESTAPPLERKATNWGLIKPASATPRARGDDDGGGGGDAAAELPGKAVNDTDAGAEQELPVVRVDVQREEQQRLEGARQQREHCADEHEISQAPRPITKPRRNSALQQTVEFIPPANQSQVTSPIARMPAGLERVHPASHSNAASAPTSEANSPVSPRKNERPKSLSSNFQNELAAKLQLGGMVVRLSLC